MGFDAEVDAMLIRLFDAPRQFVATALPGVGRFLVVEINTWQRGDMPCASGRGIVQRFEKPVLRATSPCRFGMIDRVRNETGVRLEKHVGAAEAAVGELAGELSAGSGWCAENLRGPQVRAAFKETDVHALEAQQRDQVQRAVVRQQRKGEVGAGEFELHGLLLRLETLPAGRTGPLSGPALTESGMNAVRPWVSHSAAVRYPASMT